MLTALFGALGDILHGAVVALERFAVLLERTPLGPFWRVGFVVVFQVLAFVLSRLAPELARNYRRRFAELWAGFQQWRHGTRGGEEQPKHAGMFRLLQPPLCLSAGGRRVRAAFFFFLAAAAFRSGILGRRVKPRVWEPEEDWLRQARKEDAVKSEIPGWLVAIAFFFMLARDSGKKPRRRRRLA